MKIAFNLFGVNQWLYIGLMAWSGPAAAMSKSDYLSRLRDMGLIGFQERTVLKRDVGENSFIDAAEKGDAHLLQQRLHARLNGPFADFIRDLHAADEEGRNVFHAMAAAETNQERFADIIKSLARISGYHALAGRQTSKTIEIANVILTPERQLEKTPLVRAIGAAASRADALQKVEKFIAENSAAAVISYLRGKTSRLPAQPAYFGEEKPVYQRSFLELLLSRSADPHYHPDWKTLKGITIYQPHLMRDDQGFRPIDIAKNSGNLPAFSVLYDLGEDSSWQWFAGWMAAGVSAGGAALAMIDSPAMAGIAAVSVGLAGAAGVSMCHKSFKKLPVRLNKLLTPQPAPSPASGLRPLSPAPIKPSSGAARK